MTLCSIDFGPKKLLAAARRALAEGWGSWRAGGVKMGVGPSTRPAEEQLPVECGPEREPLRESQATAESGVLVWGGCVQVGCLAWWPYHTAASLSSGLGCDRGPL